VYNPSGIGFSKDRALSGTNDSDDSSLPYNPSSSIHFNNGLGSDLGNTTISDDASSFNSSSHKFIYDPGDDRYNSTIKANSVHEGNNDPGSGIHFNNSLGSDLGNTAISNDASSFNSSCHKFIYDPGGDRSNSTTEANSACEGNDNPSSDTNHKHNFIYDPAVTSSSTTQPSPQHMMLTSFLPSNLHRSNILTSMPHHHLQPSSIHSFLQPTCCHSQMKTPMQRHSPTFKMS